MQNEWKLIAVLLISAMWLHAQPVGPGPSTGDESNHVTVDGCLQRLGWQFYLIEPDGTREQIRSTSKLGQYEGHHIEISGVRSTKTIGTTQQNEASSAVILPIIVVKSVKDLGQGCNSFSN